MTQQSTPRRERLEIRRGVPVITGEDEEVGRVDRVLMTPGTGDVAGLIVRKGLLLRRDALIPIEAVVYADENEVRVRLGRDELNELPEYHAEPKPAANPPPPATHSPGLQARHGAQTEAAAGGRPLRAGQRVLALDGEVGRVDVILVDPRTRRASAFVVRRGFALAHDSIVPVEWITDVEQDAVRLGVVRERLAELPEYRPDDEITTDVLDELWYDSELQPLDLQFVEVQTHDGVVELIGHTLDERTRSKIEEAAYRVRGVLGVRNHLETFVALEAAIRAAQRGAVVAGTSAAATD
jgi:uncharacterized protein YrrD